MHSASNIAAIVHSSSAAAKPSGLPPNAMYAVSSRAPRSWDRSISRANDAWARSVAPVRRGSCQRTRRLQVRVPTLLRVRRLRREVRGALEQAERARLPSKPASPSPVPSSAPARAPRPARMSARVTEPLLLPVLPARVTCACSSSGRRPAPLGGAPSPRRRGRDAMQRNPRRAAGARVPRAAPILGPAAGAANRVADHYVRSAETPPPRLPRPDGLVRASRVALTSSPISAATA